LSFFLSFLNRKGQIQRNADQNGKFVDQLIGKKTDMLKTDTFKLLIVFTHLKQVRSWVKFCRELLVIGGTTQSPEILESLFEDDGMGRNSDKTFVAIFIADSRCHVVYLQNQYCPRIWSRH
jgi:hypothetical protein